jgi:hypothetical protein
MPINHKKVLREFAQRAMEVVALIDEGGSHVKGFQSTPPGDVSEIEGIQIKLEEVAQAIEAYLSRQAD